MTDRGPTLAIQKPQSWWHNISKAGWWYAGLKYLKAPLAAFYVMVFAKSFIDYWLIFLANIDSGVGPAVVARKVHTPLCFMALATNHGVIRIVCNCILSNYVWGFIFAALVDILAFFQPVFA